MDIYLNTRESSMSARNQHCSIVKPDNLKKIEVNFNCNGSVDYCGRNGGEHTGGKHSKERWYRWTSQGWEGVGVVAGQQRPGRIMCVDEQWSTQSPNTYYTWSLVKCNGEMRKRHTFPLRGRQQFSAINHTFVEKNERWGGKQEGSGEGTRLEHVRAKFGALVP